MANVGVVIDGVLQDANNAITSTSKSTVGTTELGKEAFLQLLVCQMQNQDPLNPQNDTEFVSQLATFSQLEQMQNLNASYEKSQAFSLIGKDVILNVKDSDGQESQVTGKVEYVNSSGSKVQLYVDGNLYNLEDLMAVMDESYVKEICCPSIENKYEWTYDAKKPDNYFAVINLGADSYAADEVALVINDKVVSAENYKLDGNKLNIYGSAFEELPDGTYAVAVVFNDDDYTTVADKITVKVVNSEVVAEETDKDKETETDKETGTDEKTKAEA